MYKINVHNITQCEKLGRNPDWRDVVINFVCIPDWIVCRHQGKERTVQGNKEVSYADSQEAFKAVDCIEITLGPYPRSVIKNERYFFGDFLSADFW